MKGIFSALINTFDRNGAPDCETLRKVIDHNIEVCGIDGLYVNGSTGENFNLPHEYKKAFFREAAKAAKGRVALIGQVGCNVVEEIYELSDLCAELGYDAVSAVTPFYFKYTNEEIVAFYTALAERSALPIIIYNIPVRTGVALSRDDFRALLSQKNIAGVKFTANDFYLLERIRGEFPEKLIYSGFDEMLLSAAVLGTDGAIGSTYNLVGDFAAKVYNCAKSCDLAAARKYQTYINTVVEMLFKTGLMPTIKAAFRYYGIEAGNCRLPMSPNGDAQYENAREIYEFIEKARNV